MDPTRTSATFAPPIPVAQRWLAETPLPPDLPLLNVSQAAPVEPPPLALRQAIADAALTRTDAHLYGAVHGRAELRAGVARHWSALYGGEIRADQVSITSGCNQAFCAAIATLASEADEIILPTPWYFNHKMALDMAGIRAVALPTGTDLLPDPDHARALITPRSRAICLVTPNNPGGVEYPADLIAEFQQLARAHGIALIIDETYRDFHAADGAPHRLFADPDWDQTVIQLYSFSKAYRLTGHRVGALLTSPARLAEVQKFLDTHTICASQLGQIAALWGLHHLGDWLAGERREILARRAAIHSHMPLIAAQGWQLRGCGAYFACLEHPFALSSDEIAQNLLAERAILALPGTMFVPDGDLSGTRLLRVAFANIDRQGIAGLMQRLASLRWPLAPAAVTA